MRGDAGEHLLDPSFRSGLTWPEEQKRALVDRSKHVVIESAHPSPLSASNGFFGSRPFSRANGALTDAGLAPIDWAL